MTTPGPTLEDRVTILETRLDTILPTLATKEDIAGAKAELVTEIADVRTDIARLEGKMDAMNERLEGKIDTSNERLEGKIDAMGYRLLIGGTSIAAAVAAIAVAAARFL